MRSERERERKSVSNGRLFLNVEKLMYEKSVGRAREKTDGERERVVSSDGGGKRARSHLPLAN